MTKATTVTTNVVQVNRICPADKMLGRSVARTQRCGRCSRATSRPQCEKSCGSKAVQLAVVKNVSVFGHENMNLEDSWGGRDLVDFVQQKIFVSCHWASLLSELRDSSACDSSHPTL